MAARKLVESPVTVVVVAGPPRSGTTLLANLLSGSPAYPLLPECQIITGLIRERLRGEREQGEDRFRVFLHDRAFADGVYRTAIESILAELLNRSGSSARFMVLKDPFLVFHLNMINRLISWPLRKVCIVRDPRDTIASYISVRIRAGSRPPVRDAIDYFEPFFAETLRAQETSDTLLVRYEDLVRKDRGAQKRLSDHVGYPIDLEGYSGLKPDEVNGEDPWNTPLYSAAISDSMIGSYQHVLSPEDFYLINDVFSDVLATFYGIGKVADHPRHHRREDHRPE